jgi:uncharacterized protein (DUF1501 family)
MQTIAALYRTDALLGPALAEGLASQAFADRVMNDGGRMNQPPAAGRQQFVQAAAAAGRLMAPAADGARVAALDLGGWDTHANQGAARGRLALALETLAEGLAALRDGLGAAWSKTVVLVATEFGRTVQANGTGGTDHGTGGVAFLLGGAVAGGRVVTDWPGLAQDRLLEGRDLMPTADLRAVAKAVLIGHLGLAPAAVDAQVFPASAAVRPLAGLIRA